MRWLPFQLNPDLPPSGMPRAEYVRQKFGAVGNAKYQHVAEVGRSVGLDLAFDKISVQPNTVNAHRLLQHADTLGKQDVVAEALFRGYFVEGADLTQNAVLADYAAQAGLSREDVLSFLNSDADVALVRGADEEARRAGIGGVPFFIFNRAIGVSGAQEPGALLDAMQQALADARTA